MNKEKSVQVSDTTMMIKEIMLVAPTLKGIKKEDRLTT